MNGRFLLCLFLLGLLSVWLSAEDLRKRSPVKSTFECIRKRVLCPGLGWQRNEGCASPLPSQPRALTSFLCIGCQRNEGCASPLSS